MITRTPDGKLLRRGKFEQRKSFVPAYESALPSWLAAQTGTATIGTITSPTDPAIVQVTSAAPGGAARLWAPTDIYLSTYEEIEFSLGGLRFDTDAGWNVLFGIGATSNDKGVMLIHENSGTTESTAFLRGYKSIGAVTLTAADDLGTTAGAHGLAVNDKVAFASVTGGAGIGAANTYYVKTVPSSTTITVSSTLGGATINITSDGSATLVRLQDVPTHFQVQKPNGASRRTRDLSMIWRPPTGEVMILEGDQIMAKAVMTGIVTATGARAIIGMFPTDGGTHWFKFSKAEIALRHN